MEPTIVGSEWYVELDLGQIYNSEYSPNSITPQMLIFPPMIITPIVEHDFEQIEAQHATKVYKFENDDWSSTPVYSTHDGAILSLGKNSFVEDNDKDILLLVHGIKPGGKYTNFTQMARFFRKGSNLQIYAVEYETSGGLPHLGRELAEIIDRATPSGKKIKIVAHSMGGIVSRTALELYGAADKVSHLVTLSSPHLGVGPYIGHSIEMNVLDQNKLEEMIVSFIEDGNGEESAAEIERQLKSFGLSSVDLTMFSPFLTTLNASPKPSETQYFLAAGTNPAGYYDNVIGRIAGPIYEEVGVTNDGFIAENSSLGLGLNIDDTSKSYPLNHRTIRTDPEVLSDIGAWLGIESGVTIHVGVFEGHLSVNQSDVRVTLDGEPAILLYQDFEFRNVEPGMHVLRVESELYKTYEAEFRVYHESMVFTVNLEKNDNDDGNTIYPTPAGYNHNDYQKLVTFWSKKMSMGLRMGTRSAIVMIPGIRRLGIGAQGTVQR